MKRFRVGRTQGHRPDILRVERLPAHRCLWFLRVKLGVPPGESQGLRCILAKPFFALGKVHFQAVEAGEVPCWTGDRDPHFLID